jgi:hypothetical protein
MPESAPTTGTATVTVACRLPHGLVCQVHTLTKKSEPVMGGGYRDVDIWVPTGEEFTLKGTAHPQDQAPKAEMASGFALTHGIRKDWWEAWSAQYRKFPAIEQGLIFAAPHKAKVVDECKEKAGLKTGLERIDPNNPPQEFARFPIQMAEEQKAKPAV